MASTAENHTRILRLRKLMNSWKDMPDPATLSDEALDELDPKAIPVFRNLIARVSSLHSLDNQLSNHEDKVLLKNAILGGYFLLGTLIDCSFGECPVSLDETLAEAGQYLASVDEVLEGLDED